MLHNDIDTTIEIDKLHELAQLIKPKLIEQDLPIDANFQLDRLFRPIMEIFPATFQSLAQLNKSNSDQEYVMVCGPTGSGKSTLIAEILGYQLGLIQIQSNVKLKHGNYPEKTVVDYLDQVKMNLLKRPLIGHTATQTKGAIPYASTAQETNANPFIFVDTGPLDTSTSGNETDACITLASTIAFKQLAPSKILLIASSHRKEYLSLLEELQWYQQFINLNNESIEVAIAINDKLKPDNMSQFDENREEFINKFQFELEEHIAQLAEEAKLTEEAQILIQQELKTHLRLPSAIALTSLANGNKATAAILEKIQSLIQQHNNIPDSLVNASFSKAGNRVDSVVNKLASKNLIKLSKGMLTVDSKQTHLNCIKKFLLAISNFFDESLNQTDSLKKRVLQKVWVDYKLFFDNIALLAQFYRDNIQLDEIDKKILSTFIDQYKLLAATNGSAREFITTTGLSNIGMFRQLDKSKDDLVFTGNEKRSSCLIS